MTQKERYIDSIRGLFPADSQYQGTAEIGRRLLLDAMDKAGFNWRDLPEDVLRIYADMCERENINQERRLFLKDFG